MKNKCLYCYKELRDDDLDFHEKCSMQFFGSKKAPDLPYTFSQMTELGSNIVRDSIAVTGVQPKLSLSLVNKTLNSSGRMTIVGALGGNYIFKPPSVHYPEMPQNEHLTMRMAEAFGLPVVKSSLIRLESGEISYITKRIDRTENGVKIHMLDMFQILEAFDKYRGSMEKVGKAIGEYSANTLLDKVNFFELSVFCFLTGNNDMHLKNFSMIRKNNEWILSPAYDLLNVAIANPRDKEELALTLEGKRKKLSRHHFERFGKGLGLNDKQIANIFSRFFKKRAIVGQWIHDSFLSGENKEKYMELLHERYLRLE